MRQNIQDTKYRLIQDTNKNKTSLKYGLTINFDLENFDFEKLDFSNNEVSLIISDKKEVVVENVSASSSLIKAMNEFDSIHFENAKNIFKIIIPKDKKLSEPILLKNLIQSQNSTIHLQLVLEENASAIIIDFLEDEKIGDFNTKFIEIIAKENSNLEYYHLQKLNRNIIHYSKKQSFLKSNAKVNWHDITLGSKINLSELTSFLQGEEATSNINSVFFSDENQQFDFLGENIHENKKTFSNVNAKGVIKNTSQSLYRANVHIKQNSPESEGYQRADLLMLDRESEADAIPQLLIDNNDVKCSHAVAIGRLDEEKLFYLMSRGLSESEAQKLIIKGFFDATIKDINVNEVIHTIQNEIELKLN